MNILVSKKKNVPFRQSITSSNKPTIFRPTKEVQFYVYAENMGPKMEPCGTPIMPVRRRDVYSSV